MRIGKKKEEIELDKIANKAAKLKGALVKMYNQIAMDMEDVNKKFGEVAKEMVEFLDMIERE